MNTHVGCNHEFWAYRVAMPDQPDASSFESSLHWPMSANTYEGAFDTSWNQGRGVFGGLITATAIRAVRGLADQDNTDAGKRTLRMMNVRFMAPMLADTPATLVVQRDHQSKRIGHYSARLEQAGISVASVQATFAAGRSSALELAAQVRPVSEGEVDGLADMPFIPGVTPEFTQHMRIRWTSAPPFVGSDVPVTTGWCRHGTEATSGIEGIVALLDAWPAPVLSMMKHPAPASSVTWSAQFLNLPEAMPEGWFYYRSEALDCADGYARMRAQLWYPDGQLCASTEQLVAVFY